MQSEKNHSKREIKKTKAPTNDLLQRCGKYSQVLRLSPKNDRQNLFIEADANQLLRLLSDASFCELLNEIMSTYPKVTVILIQQPALNTPILDIKSEDLLQKLFKLMKHHLPDQATISQSIGSSYRQLRNLFQMTGHQEHLRNFSHDMKYFPTLNKITKEFPIPLSRDQLHLICEQLPTDPLISNKVISFIIKGNLNISALELSIKRLITRHENLRTNIDIKNKIQYLAETKSQWSLEVAIANQKSEIETFASEESKSFGNIQFDLKKTPLLRSKVIELRAKEGPAYLWMCSLHPAIFDDQSQAIFLTELGHYYSYYAHQTPLTLGGSPVPFDYYTWSKVALKNSNNSTQYWKEQIPNLQPLALATDFTRASNQASEYNQVFFTLPSKLIQRLKILSKKLSVNFSIALLASFQYLLYRYTGQDDFCMGSMIDLREKKSLQHLKNSIGMLTTNIAIRSKIDNNMTIEQFVLAIAREVDNGIKNTDICYPHLIKDNDPTTDLNNERLFNTLFVFHNNDYLQLKLPNLTTIPIEQVRSAFGMDLILELRENADFVSGFFQYQTGLFKKETIARMARNYQTLLENFNNPQTKISELTILSQEEQKLIASFNKPFNFNQTLCIHEIFEKNVKKFPHKLALAFGENKLTYQELNDMANIIANNLLANGIKPESVIAVCMERSFEAEILVLAILKAGCALLFVESDEAQIPLIFKKIKSILPSAVIVDNHTQKFFQDSPSFIEHQELFHSIKLFSYFALQDQKYGSHNPRVKVTIDSLALMGTTSGSTGNPKGVLVPHRGWSNWIYFFEMHGHEYHINVDSVIFESAPYTFDASLWERLLAYGLGGTLYVNSTDDSHDGRVLQELFAKGKITVATFTPSILATLNPRDFSTLRCVFVVGENLPKELVVEWKKVIPDLIFVNGYGPTEITAGVSLFKCTEDSPVYIGKPILNMQIHILDEYKKPVPIGACGQIYIGGVGVARGYHNLPEKTREVFIPDCFSKIPHAKLYATGDLARFMPDGNVEFKGRINGDDQVKLHGVRIELGEIESLLAMHPKVKHAFVKLCNNDYLAAYVIPREGVSIDSSDLAQFKTYLNEKGLALIKMPAIFIPIDHIPLTKNGKLDKKALPTPVRSGILKRELVLPKTPTEEALLKLWQYVFGYKEISTSDDFVELGGSSFIVVRLINKINIELLQGHAALMITNLPKDSKGFKFDIQCLATLIDDLKSTNKINTSPFTKSMNERFEEAYSNYTHMAAKI